MRIDRTLLIMGIVAGLTSSGCQFLPHSMQTSQLWKMNRQDAWDEGQFSIPDPVDPRLEVRAADAHRGFDGGDGVSGQ